MWTSLEAFDLALMNWLRGWNAAWLDIVMAGISASGVAGLIWLVLCASAFTKPRYRAAACRVLLTLGLSYGMVDGVLKPMIGRSRPGVHATDPKRALPPLPRSYSFPSGHATSTFGAALAVSRMWPQTTAVWWTIAVLTGYSRIYLGHHYPLDVLGGAVLGIAIAFWVLGGRHPATYASAWPNPLPRGVHIKP